MGLRVQSTVGCFPELCLLQFSVAQVLGVLRKHFINNFVFPTWACAAGFSNNNVIYTGVILSQIITLRVCTTCYLRVSVPGVAVICESWRVASLRQHQQLRVTCSHTGGI